MKKGVNKGVQLYCIMCGNIFYRYRPRSTGGRRGGLNMRNSNAITCSKKCSRLFAVYRMSGAKKHFKNINKGNENETKTRRRNLR